MNYMRKISPIHYLFGCRFDCLINLLMQNKFKIVKGKRGQTFAIVIVALLGYPFVLLESLFSHIFINRRKIKQQPLFVLGFWRSGTTYLQNMLCEDKQFSYLNTVTSYSNNCCILLKPLVTAYMKKFSSEFRFMDNMESNINSPCEEEFAVANRTTKSIIHMATFPRNFELYKKFTFTKNLSRKETQKWKKDYLKVIKKVSFINKQKPLILKSPDNTCHVKELNELFPESNYIYIYRNPYKVVCSFKHTIKKMIEHFSLQQVPEDEQIEDFVIDIYKQIMKQYKIDKKALDGRLIEIKYEDFVKSPIKYLQEIYSKFNISGFEFAKENFEKLLESQKDYKTNTYEIKDSLKQKIQNELSEVFYDYGYDM